ncbi:hypothetical protein [Phenylobacterium sp.]|uniref:hypothetical protein n=1 Tax=Phenylobacterium sp. TaxID=1871053 RepID=UPI0025CEA28B|nr:hypothetical protein [Phenylobacterium sp.]
MLAGLRQILFNPLIAAVALASTIALAVALGVLSNGWNAERARYEARIAELTHASEKAEASFRMELASCQAAGAARQTPEQRVAAADAPPGARRLLEQGPEGIDACARMESADQAVLSNLKK